MYSAILGSFLIMIFLFLHPKAIGIENSVRMATRLAPAPSPSSRYSLPTRSPTNFARSLSQQLMGKPGDTAEELVDEFEELVGLLEKDGHIEPDAGRIIRSALASSKKVASDTLTPLEIVSAKTTSTVSEVLKLMGSPNQTRLPSTTAIRGSSSGR